MLSWVDLFLVSIDEWTSKKLVAIYLTYTMPVNKVKTIVYFFFY